MNCAGANRSTTKPMNELIMQQARDIHKTVRMLQDKLAQDRAANLKSPADCSVEVDLTFRQCNAMMVIREEGAITIKRLAQFLGVSPPSASAMVDRLVEMGMLEREQSRVDRREVEIRISQEGETGIRLLESQILSTVTDLLARLGPDYARQWSEVYARIRAIITEQRGGASPDEKKKEQTV